MNLINCSENCVYQHEGGCKLGSDAPISPVKVGGCNYFVEQKDKKDKKQDRE